MMTSILTGAIGSLLMGIIWRIRGGFLPTGSTFVARALACTTFGIFAFLLTDFNYWMLFCIPLLFAGVVKGWAEWADMGTWEGTIKGDFIGMSLRGLLLTGPVGAFLFVSGYMPVFLLAGVLLGSVYYLSYKLFSDIGNIIEIKGSYMFDGFTSVAEFLTGVIVLGLNLYITVALLPQHNIINIFK